MNNCGTANSNDMEKKFVASNINAGGVQQNTYDAIVIGSGISGGWAAKELCEQGLKTLVLERGRNVEHNKDYPTATKEPWEFKHRGQMTKHSYRRTRSSARQQVLEKIPRTFLLKTKTTLTYRKNRSTGSVVTR